MPEVIPGCRLCLLVAGSGYGVTRPVQVRRKAREESDPRGTVPNQETLITRFPKAPKETNLGDLAPSLRGEHGPVDTVTASHVQRDVDALVPVSLRSSSSQLGWVR